MVPHDGCSVGTKSWVYTRKRHVNKFFTIGWASEDRPSHDYFSSKLEIIIQALD